jgi:gas vesicle protein GvpL/GvpF
MSTHLYCVLPEDAPGEIPPGLSGVAGGQVRAIPVENLVAWVSDVARDVPVSVDGVRAHDAVVEAALETGSTPVPARFGQRFDDDLACQLALTSRAASVESIVTGVQGLIEMTILIAPSTRRMLRDLEPVIPDMIAAGRTGPGRKYLDTLRAREAATGTIGRATDELAERIESATEGYVRKSTVHHTGTPLPLRTISHLVAREDLDDYREAIGAVDGGSEFRFLVIGPRAPYSFCALKSDGGKHGMNLAD